MYKHFTFLASALGLCYSSYMFPSSVLNDALKTRTILSKRSGEPEMGDDLPDTDDHPNQLDQVETAFEDALLLADFAYGHIDNDDTIFLHYFDEGDRAGVKNVFGAIIGAPGVFYNGNDLLDKLLVQTTDTEKSCSEQTLVSIRGIYFSPHNLYRSYVTSSILPPKLIRQWKS